VDYRSIYEGGFLQAFTGWMAPSRFFIEAIGVSEYRCYPEQSGFTAGDNSSNYRFENSTYAQSGLALHDPNVLIYSCDGWYWSVLPVILVGITLRFLALGAMYGFYRAQQTKKPLVVELKNSQKMRLKVIAFTVVFLILFIVTTVIMFRTLPNEREEFNYNDRNSINTTDVNGTQQELTQREKDYLNQVAQG